MADRHSRLLPVFAGCCAVVLAALLGYYFGRSSIPPSTKAVNVFCNPVLSVTLPVVLEAQKATMWCWIASPQMAMKALGANPAADQCNVATDVLQSDCCGSPLSSACDVGGWPEEAFGARLFGFHRKITCPTCTGGAPSGNDNPLTLEEIKRQIYCQKKPVVFVWKFDGGGSHVLVIYGYDGDVLMVMDPLPMANSNAPGGNTFRMIYDAFLSGAYDDKQTGDIKLYQHWIDYYDITQQ